MAAGLTTLSHEGDDFTIEEGEIRWFCQPKPYVSRGQIRQASDVAGFYYTMSLWSQPGRHRLLQIAKDRLPDTEPRGSVEMTTGVVVKAGDSLEDVLKAVRDDSTPANTPLVDAGTGLYAIVGRGVPETHLFLDATRPEKPDALERLLHIHKYGTFRIEVKSPEAATPYRVGTSYQPPGESAAKAAELSEQDASEQWMPVHDTSLLDESGTEIRLFPSSTRCDST